MPFPAGHKVIDTMMGIPVSEDNSEWYESFKPLLRDAESLAMFKMPAQYMFKDIPQVGPVEDKVAWTVGHMDRFNITRAMIGFGENSEGSLAAHARFRDRFFFDLSVNPNLGMDEVRRIREMKRKYNIEAVSVFPSGVNPQVPINDKKFYPIYTACVEENLPIFVCTGVPGPRVPMACQDVHLVDEVCWFFPELKFVMRHGAEPHVDMAVKLMLKYPNLYYSTSAFAPKHYPQEIINFANSRGSDKILYAGYFPMGLSLDRIFKELNDVPFNDNVWPKFLYENALKVLGASV
jgi:predicted TIM-barrel fold metal-dependent hydrolase